MKYATTVYNISSIVISKFGFSHLLINKNQINKKFINI